ncbi:TPA: M14 family metallopeptidase [Bacillus cereus]
MPVTLNKWLNTWANADFRNHTNENWASIEQAINTLERDAAANTITSSPTLFGNQPVTFDLINKQVIVPTTTALMFRNTRYLLPNTTIQLLNDGSLYQVLFFNPKTNTFKVKNTGVLPPFDKDDITIAVIDFFSNNVYAVGKYKVIGKPSIPKEEISNSISSFPIISADNPTVFDFIAGTIKIISGTSIYVRNTRYQLPNTTISMLDSSLSMHQILFYNPKTSTYEVKPGSQISSVSDDSIIIAVMDLRNKNAYALGNYIVNSKAGTKDKVYQFSDEEIVGTYTPTSVEVINGTVEGGFDERTVMVNDVYALWDTLMSENPNYIKKELIGYDHAGTLPIYKYEFTPTKPNNEINFPYKEFPKMIIGGGIHGNGQQDAGDRYTQVFSLYFFFRDICRNWKTNEILEYLRWNVRFVIVPIQNPWGFNNRSRRNQNQVDLNRNYDYNWKPGTIGENAYPGPSPFSESESRAMRDLVLQHSDAISLVDFHTRGGNPTDDKLIMYDMSKGNELFYPARTHVTKMTHRWKEYGFTDVDFYGYIIDVISPISKLHDWSTNVAGVPGLVVEGFANSGTAQPVPSNGEEIMRMNTELVGNWIWFVLKYYKNKSK